MSKSGQNFYDLWEKSGFQEDQNGNCIINENTLFKLLTDYEKRQLYRKRIAFLRNKAFGLEYNKQNEQITPENEKYKVTIVTDEAVDHSEEETVFYKITKMHQHDNQLDVEIDFYDHQINQGKNNGN